MPHISWFPYVPGGTHLHRSQHVMHARMHSLFLEWSLHLWSQSGMQSALDFTGGKGADVGVFAGGGVVFDGGDGTLAGAGAGTGTLAYGGDGAFILSSSSLDETLVVINMKVATKKSTALKAMGNGNKSG